MGQKKISENADYQLWERFKKGEKQVLAHIFQKHYSSLYSYGYRICQERALVEDCIQELFIELISNQQNLGPVDHIGFYLLASVRRKIYGNLKRKKQTGIREDEDEILPDNQEISPEDSWIKLEESHLYNRTLQEILKRLPARVREAIYLRYYRNYSYQEITRIMGVNYKTARMLIYRGIKSMREQSKEAFK